MAQIMDFFLNLLLLRGKFFTTAAAETLHAAIRKCLRFKRKISMEYNNATQMIGPFENMMEFINYNARQYTCEDRNYVVTSEIRYKLYEELSKIKEQNQQNPLKNEGTITQINPEVLKTVTKKIEIDPNFQNNSFNLWCHEDNKENKIQNQDYLADNLHAILKSQELLFKNIIKLVNFLEKDATFNLNRKHLENIKHKLVACRDVLSGAVSSRKFSDIINNIIEEEITRCRFRNGECKTSAQISLKVSKPRGIEIALETSRPAQTKTIKKLQRDNKATNETLRRQEIDSEVRRNSLKFLGRSKSEPTLRSSSINKEKNYEKSLKRSKTDVNWGRLIEINEEHFNQFENTLWHSSTTLKFTSLKDDYTNLCKCAFYNKRQFIAVESTISKQYQKEHELGNASKLLTVSDSVFQVLERRLVFERNKNTDLEEVAKKDSFLAIKQQIEENVKSKIPKAINVDKISFSKVQQKPEIKRSKVKSKLVEKKEKILFAVPPKDTKLVMNQTSLQKLLMENKRNQKTTTEPTHIDKETNTIINGNNLQKILDKFLETTSIPLDHENTGKIVETLKLKSQDTQTTEPRITRNDAKPVLKLEEIKSLTIIQNKDINLAKGDICKIVNLFPDVKDQKIQSKSEPKISTHKKKVIISGKKLFEKVKENQKLRNSQSVQNVRNESILESKHSENIPNKEEKIGDQDLALQAIANSDGKLFITQTSLIPFREAKSPRCLSVSELQSAAELIHVNEKAFGELETTLKTVRIFIKDNSVITRTKSSPTQSKSRGLDDANRKRFSTKPFHGVDQKLDLISKSGLENKKKDKYNLPNEKCKTFLKTSSKLQLSNTVVTNVRIGDKYPLNMRRTTKTVINKQQVQTISPKISKKEEKINDVTNLKKKSRTISPLKNHS